MRAVKMAVGALLVTGLLYTAGWYWIVTPYNQRVEASQTREQQLQDDKNHCRITLGIETDFGQRKVMMACAHDVIGQDMSKGVKRSDAADHAWQQCIMDLSSCERVTR